MKVYIFAIFLVLFLSQSFVFAQEDEDMTASLGLKPLGYCLEVKRPEIPSGQTVNNLDYATFDQKGDVQRMKADDPDPDKRKKIEIYYGADPKGGPKDSLRIRVKPDDIDLIVKATVGKGSFASPKGSADTVTGVLNVQRPDERAHFYTGALSYQGYEVVEGTEAGKTVHKDAHGEFPNLICALRFEDAGGTVASALQVGPKPGLAVATGNAATARGSDGTAVAVKLDRRHR